MKFRKKPVVIEAEQFTLENKDRAFNFITCNAYPKFDENNNPIIEIETLEGDMIASLGDWIIKEPFATVDRQFYPCKPDIFEKTYELVN